MGPKTPVSESRCLLTLREQQETPPAPVPSLFSQVSGVKGSGAELCLTRLNLDLPAPEPIEASPATFLPFALPLLASVY